MYKNIHMLGIGGIGMSGIAKILLQKDISVSGCDISRNGLTDKLIENGALVFKGHSPMHITESIDLVVRSSAVPESHPELIRANNFSIPVWKRAQMLQEIIKEKECIAVTGTHGKTTVSFMIACILKEAGLDPSFVIGGEVPNLGGNAHLGSGKHFVVEADESDGSQIYIKPKMAVITNIDRDHLENYSDISDISSVMKRFIENIQNNGCLVGCGEDVLVRDLLNRSNVDNISYGFRPKEDLYATNILNKEWRTQFDVIYKKNLLGRFILGVPGKHNIINALAAIAIALKLDVSREIIKNALEKYSGVIRRLEIVYKDAEITLIDDYAHHPEEVKAVVDAVRQNKDGRLIGVFQPHRFTRTKFLGREFAPAFLDLDLLVLTDIYSAGETAILGVDEKIIYDEIIKQGRPKVIYMKLDKIADFIKGNLKEQDTVVFMGAGSITNVVHTLKSKIQREKNKIKNRTLISV